MSRSKVPSSDPHSIPLLSESQDDNEQQNCTNRSLYPPQPPPKRSLLNRYSWIVAVILLLIFVGLLAIPKPSRHSPDIEDDYDDEAPVPDSSGICKQLPPMDLVNDEISRELEKVLKSKDFLKEATERLSGAVQIPTESFDDMGPVDRDPRWDIFK